MKTRRKAKAPTFVSLFCGCGGLDLGFIDSGYTCAGAFDINPLAIANYNSNLGHYAQVRDLNAGLPDASALKDVDVLLAGAPCQGFSTVGKRLLDDPRNQLLKTTARIAREVRPKVVVVENVPGVLAGEHRELWTKLERSLRAADCSDEDECSRFNPRLVPGLRRR